MEISKNSSTSPLTIVNIIEDTPSQRAGLLPGDIISYIGEAGRENIPTVSLQNANDAVKLLRGVPGTLVNLKVIRKGVEKPMEFAVKRDIIKIVQIKGDLIKSGDKTYALIENRQFHDGNKNAMREKYRELLKRAEGKLSGLIIRVENNPGGLLNEAYYDIDLFLDAQSLVLTKSNDSIDVYTPQGVGRERIPGDITNGLPMLVVVNGGSASAAEVFSGAMKHFGRAVIAGTSRTFGKGIVQSIYSVPGGAAVKLTSSEYYVGTKTDWTPVQCIGVEPDILFEYAGIKTPQRSTECELSGHVGTSGPMINGPKHRPIKEANPELYKAGEVMLEAYKAYMTPKLLIEEEKRKQREAE
jgi:carboxyl-terminal processing protease